MINGKVYIGKTESDLKVRRAGHYQSVKRGSESNFHRALRKGNRNDFKWEILNEYNTKEDMDVFVGICGINPEMVQNQLLLMVLNMHQPD